MNTIQTPIEERVIDNLKVGDILYLSGSIYCGRDAVLPKIVTNFEEGTLWSLKIDLEGSVIFHTAVSIAGVGPTSSNKMEIESSIEPLSRAGVKLHLGKGKISFHTIEALRHLHAVYAVIPPVTALLENRIKQKELVAFPELGMEAFYRLQIEKFPVIIAAAHGEGIYR